MDCLICIKLFIFKTEYGNYKSNPELCASAISKLFQISDNPDVQGVFEGLVVCRSCHLKLENVLELVTQLEELQRRVNEAKIEILNELVNSKEVNEARTENIAAALMSKSSLDRVTLLKAIEGNGNTASQGIGAVCVAMDVQEENDDVHIESVGIDENHEEISHQMEIESFQGPSRSSAEYNCNPEKTNENEASKSKAGYALPASKKAITDEESSEGEDIGSDFEAGDDSEGEDESENEVDTNSNGSGEANQEEAGKQHRRAKGTVLKEFTRLENGSFQCKHCPSIIKKNIGAHILIHNPPKFKCSVQNCGKRFKQKYIRDNHVKNVHEKRRDFQCSWAGCEKKFSEKKNLNIHVKSIHRGMRDFKCGICGKEFVRNKELLKHISNKHTAAKKKTEVGRAINPEADISAVIKLEVFDNE